MIQLNQGFTHTNNRRGRRKIVNDISFTAMVVIREGQRGYTDIASISPIIAGRTGWGAMYAEMTVEKVKKVEDAK